jgi:hypothetical protein
MICKFNLSKEDTQFFTQNDSPLLPPDPKASARLLTFGDKKLCLPYLILLRLEM